MASATEVNVTLQEWAVLPDTLSVPAGSVTFNATNIGPMDPHELVVVKTDIPAAELPTREDGAFDEEAEGVEVIGEIEEFDVGLTESLTLELAPGYVRAPLQPRRGGGWRDGGPLPDGHVGRVRGHCLTS